MGKTNLSQVFSNFSTCWYITTVYTLAFSLILLVIISTPKQVETPIKVKYQPFQALPYGELSKIPQIQYIQSEDGRSLLIEQFYDHYNSPLSEYASVFVTVADKYKLDYRLLPSISMQESNGAKVLPEGSFNPFGYGIYGDNSLGFRSYEEAIERVGRGIREDYIDQGLKTPYQIMTKYTPSSLAKGGPWAIGVELFMDELE